MNVNPYESPKAQAPPEATSGNRSAFIWTIRGAVWGMTMFAQIAGVFNLMLAAVVTICIAEDFSGVMIGLGFYACSTFTFSFVGTILGLLLGAYVGTRCRSGSQPLDRIGIAMGIVMCCLIPYWMLFGAGRSPFDYVLVGVLYLFAVCIGGMAGRELGRKIDEQMNLEGERFRTAKLVNSASNTDIDLT